MMDDEERFLETIITPIKKVAGLRDEDKWQQEKHSDFENVIIKISPRKRASNGTNAWWPLGSRPRTRGSTNRTYGMLRVPLAKRCCAERPT